MDITFYLHTSYDNGQHRANHSDTCRSLFGDIGGLTKMYTIVHYPLIDILFVEGLISQLRSLRLQKCKVIKRAE